MQPDIQIVFVPPPAIKICFGYQVAFSFASFWTVLRSRLVRRRFVGEQVFEADAAGRGRHG